MLRSFKFTVHTPGLKEDAARHFDMSINYLNIYSVANNLRHELNNFLRNDKNTFPIGLSNEKTADALRILKRFCVWSHKLQKGAACMFTYCDGERVGNDELGVRIEYDDEIVKLDKSDDGMKFSLIKDASDGVSMGFVPYSGAGGLKNFGCGGAIAALAIVALVVIGLIKLCTWVGGAEQKISEQAAHRVHDNPEFVRLVKDDPAFKTLYGAAPTNTPANVSTNAAAK